MITHINQRDNGGGMEEIGQYQQLPISALHSLVLNELGFGGQILELEPTRVTVQTRILHCTDVTIFEGSEEEMALLVQVAINYLAIMGGGNQEVWLNRAATIATRAPLNGNPLLVSMVAPILLGQVPTTLAFLSAIGVSNETEIEVMGRMGLGDLFAAYQLCMDMMGEPSSLMDIIRQTTVV